MSYTSNKSADEEAMISPSSPLSRQRPRCPKPDCGGIMTEGTTRRGLSPSPNGLMWLYCLTCDHHGTVSTEGIHLVFRTGNQFYCTYSAAPVSIEVIVPPASRAEFSRYALSDTQLVQQAVAWALLSGKQHGTVHLKPEYQDYAALHRYLTDRLSPMNTLPPTLSDKPTTR